MILNFKCTTILRLLPSFLHFNNIALYLQLPLTTCTKAATGDAYQNILWTIFVHLALTAYVAWHQIPVNNVNDAPRGLKQSTTHIHVLRETLSIVDVFNAATATTCCKQLETVEASKLQILIAVPHFHDANHYYGQTIFKKNLALRSLHKQCAKISDGKLIKE